MVETQYPVGTSMDDVDRSGPYIGGSEAPVLALGNVYGKTPADLWLEKLGRVEGFAGNKRTAFGTLLEPFVRDWAASFFGQKIEPVPPWVPHPEHEFMRASLDGWIIPNGQPGVVVEIKTTANVGDWGPSWDSDGIPDHVKVQCQHNMACYDSDKTLVVVMDTGGLADRTYRDEWTDTFLSQLVAAHDKRCYELSIDRPFVDDLIELEEEFAKCVKEERQPGPLSLENVLTLHPRGMGTIADATPEDLPLISELGEVRARIRKDEAREKEIKAILGGHMRTVSALQWDGQDVLRWKNDKGLDVESLKRDHPALYENYCTNFDRKSFEEAYPDILKRYMVEGIGTRKMTIPKGVK